MTTKTNKKPPSHSYIIFIHDPKVISSAMKESSKKTEMLVNFSLQANAWLLVGGMGTTGISSDAHNMI